MAIAHDITGQKFGKLTAIRRVKNGKGYQTRWLVRCDCGTEFEVFTANLKKGRTKTCGCKPPYKTHGMSGSREYRTWHSMLVRCYNPNAREYHHYGGRGIDVCDEWRHSFEAFYADMGSRPRGTSIERINNNAGYSPDNCRWASPKEQMQNTRATARITFDGQTHSIAEWARLKGLSITCLYNRFFHGWSVERALTEPKNKAGRPPRIPSK
jgi:hypothetical protein